MYPICVMVRIKGQERFSLENCCRFSFFGIVGFGCFCVSVEEEGVVVVVAVIFEGRFSVDGVGEVV